MFIYKITNTVNNKIYIGQTYNKTIYDRFKRHLNEASETSVSLIGKAIYKYGKDKFVVELIDEATSLQELNEKEKYWIKHYNSTNRNIGYNLTFGGDGGNTYACKTKEEMDEIKKKISNANYGINNGMSKPFKALNVVTNQIIHFNTLHEACKYFNRKNKQVFVAGCENKMQFLFKKEWTFAYEENEFNVSLPKAYDASLRKGIKHSLTNLETGEEMIFNSASKLNQFLNVPKGYLKFENNECIYKNFKIVKL